MGFQRRLFACGHLENGRARYGYPPDAWWSSQRWRCARPGGIKLTDPGRIDAERPALRTSGSRGWGGDWPNMPERCVTLTYASEFSGHFSGAELRYPARHSAGVGSSTTQNVYYSSTAGDAEETLIRRNRAQGQWTDRVPTPRESLGINDLLQNVVGIRSSVSKLAVPPAAAKVSNPPRHPDIPLNEHRQWSPCRRTHYLGSN